MNIMFCGDGNIADGVIIATLSLLRNTKEQLHIYLITAAVDYGGKHRSALTKTFSDYLDNLVKGYDLGNFVRLFDISDMFACELPTANMATRFTPCCMLRLYADKISELPSRILYLDNDVVIRGDISGLYNSDLQGKELAGCLDYYGSWFFRNNIFRRDYLNSGVLLLDMDRIRQTGLFERCRKRCTVKKMLMPDQSAINKLCKDKVILQRKYNEQRKTHHDTLIRHFTTSFRFLPIFHKVSVKPWNIDGMRNILKTHEYDSILNEYLKLKEDMKYGK